MSAKNDFVNNSGYSSYPESKEKVFDSDTCSRNRERMPPVDRIYKFQNDSCHPKIKRHDEHFSTNVFSPNKEREPDNELNYVCKQVRVSVVHFYLILQEPLGVLAHEEVACPLGLGHEFLDCALHAH